MKHKLVTEKQGRLFAIETLESMRAAIKRGNHAGLSPHSGKSEGVDTSEPSVMMIFRNGPQYHGLYRAFNTLAKHATDDAIKGFHVVMTDYIGCAIEGGVLDIPRLRSYERRGEYEQFGSLAYRNPRAAKAAIRSRRLTYKTPK